MNSKRVLTVLATVVVAATMVSTALCLKDTSDDGTIFTMTRSDDGDVTYVTCTGDYRFDDYLGKGSSDLDELYSYLSDNVTCGRRINGVNPVNCSSFIVGQDDGSGYYTGRNFDFRYSIPGVVFTSPEGCYASVSTVDLRMFGDTHESYGDMVRDTRFNAVAYIPLDGLNEKGVYVCINSVNSGSPVVQDDEGKVSIFTTSALRLVLDHADSTESAVDLISGYNLRSEADYHLFICDDSGSSVTVEYVGSEMHVTETRLLTNHYLTAAGKDTPVKPSSAQRFETISEALRENPTMSESQVRSVMRSVMQDNPDKVHYTRWSVVYDLENLSVGICVRAGDVVKWDDVHRYGVSGTTG